MAAHRRACVCVRRAAPTRQTGGASTGELHIRYEAELSAAGDAFTGRSVAVVFDTGGREVGRQDVTVAATRFGVAAGDDGP
jgi:hypothetical protein